MLLSCSSSVLRRHGFDPVGFAQRLVYFTGDPQSVHQHGQLSGDSDDGSLFGVRGMAVRRVRAPPFRVPPFWRNCILMPLIVLGLRAGTANESDNFPLVVA